MLQTGAIFPEFALPDQTGATHTLESIKGSKTVIYFYPKDDTTGCTQEACEFRDSISDFEGVKIFGVSPDSVKSHKKFETKWSLNFPLLSDEEHTLLEACGLWVEKSMYGKKYMGVERTTVVLDEEGRILKVWNKVKPAGHAADVLEFIISLD